MSFENTRERRRVGKLVRHTSKFRGLGQRDSILTDVYLRRQFTLILSSLEGDLRQDLREGFATRNISPSELASMNSTDLASEERLKEMKQNEKEALKSLVRIDDAIPTKPLVGAGAESDRGLESAVVIAETIDLDSIVDLDEPYETKLLGKVSQTVFLDGSAQPNVLDQTITTSGSVYLPLYPMSPGGSDGPSGLGHSASADGLARRLSPSDIVDEKVGTYYSVHRGHPLLGGGPTPCQPLPASGESEDKEHFESLISRYYDGDGEPASAKLEPSVEHRDTAAEGMKGKRIVWRGEVS